MKPTILCVDDEIDNVEALARLFRNKYTVLKAVSGPQALDLLDENPDVVSVIITDQRMPEMTGVDFLQESIVKSPHSVRILLTGYTDIESIIEAVNSGQIYRYLNKPWDPVDLLSTVDRAVERFNLNRELEKKNRELSLALSELKTLDQAKTQFMVLINHELKTPLTSILNFTDLLKETRLTEEQELCTLRIGKSALRLRVLIDDVLLVIKSEMGNLQVRADSFACADLKPELPADLQELATQKHLRIVYRWAEKTVLADRGLLLQVLVRLTHNAVKFGVEGSQVLVRSDFVANGSHGGRLRFAVHNQGSAVSGDMIHKIMRPFFIDENMMNHSSGMGLGLTVCQAILRSHGSQLQILNEADGVEVFFELPCL
jgi:signal transduction histidine kinase